MRELRGHFARTILAGALLLGSAASASAQERQLDVDATRSSMTVFAYKDGFLSGLGHDHTIDVGDMRGRVSYDAAHPERGKVRFAVRAASLLVKDDIDEDDRQEIKTNMDEQVLEVNDHKTIRFESTSVVPLERTADSAHLRVTGDLTLHGVTRRIDLVLDLREEADGIKVTGKTSLKQSDYDIEPFSVLLGTIKVKDEVDLSFEIVARPPDAKQAGTR